MPVGQTQGFRHESVIPTGLPAGVLHGDPIVVGGVPGMAAKIAQLGPYVDPTNQAATQGFVAGENFVIMLDPVVEARAARFGVGQFAAATRDVTIFLDPADMLLYTAQNAGLTRVRFGRVVANLAARNLCRINTRLRDTF